MFGALLQISISIYLLPLAGAVYSRMVPYPSVALVRRTILASLCCSRACGYQLVHRPRVEVLLKTFYDDGALLSHRW